MSERKTRQMAIGLDFVLNLFTIFTLKLRYYKLCFNFIGGRIVWDTSQYDGTLTIFREAICVEVNFMMKKNFLYKAKLGWV